MTLAGGDPDSMDFRRFLDVAYALLAEEYQRIDPLKDLMSVAQAIAPNGSSERPQVRTTVAQTNDQSMSLLKGMMAGVQK